MRLFNVSSEFPSLPSSIPSKNIGLLIIPAPMLPPIIDCIIIISTNDDDDDEDDESDEVPEDVEEESEVGIEPVSVEVPSEDDEEVEESSKSESARSGEIPPIWPFPPIPPKACIIIRFCKVESPEVESEFEFKTDSNIGLNPIVVAARHAKSFIVGLVIVAKITVYNGTYFVSTKIWVKLGKMG